MLFGVRVEMEVGGRDYDFPGAGFEADAAIAFPACFGGGEVEGAGEGY